MKFDNIFEIQFFFGLNNHANYMRMVGSEKEKLLLEFGDIFEVLGGTGDGEFE